MIMLNLFK